MQPPGSKLKRGKESRLMPYLFCQDWVGRDLSSSKGLCRRILVFLKFGIYSRDSRSLLCSNLFMTRQGKELL